MIYVFKVAVWLFVVLSLSSCGGDVVGPTDEELISSYEDNKNALVRISDVMRQSGLVRVTRDSVYPKTLAKSDLAMFVQREMARIGIDVAVQCEVDGVYCEYVYWSYGLAGRGKAKILIYSRRALSEVGHVNEKMKQGIMECGVVAPSWYVCGSYE